jgi:hypothetical protein
MCKKNLYKAEWHEAGNEIYNYGAIIREKVPWIVWFLDKWLGYGHEWWAKIPGWHWFWNKILPDWGDPFCAAYCFCWSDFVWKHTKQEYFVQVGFDNLSQQYKDWYKDELR